MKDIIVIDDFYPDPISVRNAALDMRFDNLGNYPGMRTDGVCDNTSESLKNIFQQILGTDIVGWQSHKKGSLSMNTCFQLCLEYDQSWVHHDSTGYAAVVYLTPDADPDSGTGFFQHQAHNISKWDRDIASTDINQNPDLRNQDDWTCHTEIKNIFNRCVLYRGELYHRSMKPGFGRNYVQGRLTQTFFFDT